MLAAWRADRRTRGKGGNVGRLRLHTEERGSLLAALMLSMVVLLASGLVLFQVARASSLRAEAVTAADAAAVAAGKELLRQLQNLDHVGFDWGAVCARARDYAARNGATLTGCRQAGPFDVQVTVHGATTIGELDRSAGTDERRATARARARVEFARFGPGGGVPVGNVSAGISDAIRLAQSMGLVVTSTTGGRHTPTSYHYRGMAADVAGTPAQMSAFYDAALARYSDIAELFYDPRGGIKHNRQIGAIGGHGRHVHIALTGTGMGPDTGEPPEPDPSDGSPLAGPTLPVGEVRLVPWDG